MAKRNRPKLRTANKVPAPYKLNQFPKEFHLNVAKEVVYILATKGIASIEGNEWERIFAESIGAKWSPSNIGLDDVVMGNTAWGAKTIKSKRKDFRLLKEVPLISGRNSPMFSYNDTIDVKHDPDEVGAKVLQIWNDRVASVRSKFENLRTVVLVKSNDLSQVAIFEFDTDMYVPEMFKFEWNKGNNLKGYDKITKKRRFTWQTSGSQFTIHEPVPSNKMVLKIRRPTSVDKKTIIKATGFNSDWVTIVK